MAWATALMLALAGTSAGLQASGTVKPPSGPPPRPGKTVGGPMSGVPYSPVGKGQGGVPYSNDGGFSSLDGGPKPMIGNAGNTGSIDVLGALSGTPTASMGGPMGMLSSGPSTGMYKGALSGAPMTMPGVTGALSGGGTNPAMLQMALAGLNAGQGMMSGQQEIGPALTGAAMQSLPAMAAAGQPGMPTPSSIDNIPPPPGADPDDFAAFVQRMKAQAAGGGQIPGMPGMPGMY